MEPAATLNALMSAEDLVLYKLRFGRPDVVDLERLIAVRPQLERSYVRS